MKINRKPVILAALVLTGSAHAAITVMDDDGNRDAAAGPNVTTTGFSSHDNGGFGSASQYFNSTNAFNGSGASNNGGTPTAATATYTFGGLLVGQVYDVYATWAQGGQGNTGPGTYTVSDGLGAIGVNQTAAVASDIQITDPFDSSSKNFQLLGQVTEDGDGMITITLSSDGSNFVLADAVAINSVPEPSSTALLGLGGLALVMHRRK